MKIAQALKLVFLLFVAGGIQSASRSMSAEELKNSVQLYNAIKYHKVGIDDSKKLEEEVRKLLMRGARPDSIFDFNTTALSIAQAKKMETIVTLIINQDPLKNVWQELERRGIIKKQSKL
jgi:ribonuclease HII